MDTNVPNQSDTSAATSQSQTGSPQNPVQVENVQYGIRVGSFSSRMGLAFTVASTSLVILAVTAAYALHGLVLQQLGLIDVASKEAAGRFVWLVALAIPLVPLYFFSNKRLNTFMGDATFREDIVFKKRLRRALWSEIILAAVMIASGVYTGLSVLLLDAEGNAIDGFTSALFYGGAFALLALWSYAFQKKTVR